jgi:hypothetical protein
VAEFELGLEEVALEPVHGVLADLVVEECFGCWSGDSAAAGNDSFVLLFEHGIADVGVGDRHCGAAMTEYGHNRLDAGSTFGKLSANGVTKSVRGDGCLVIGIDESGCAARDVKSLVE